jgi:hypothetical protein
MYPANDSLYEQKNWGSWLGGVGGGLGASYLGLDGWKIDCNPGEKIRGVLVDVGNDAAANLQMWYLNWVMVWFQPTCAIL